MRAVNSALAMTGVPERIDVEFERVMEVAFVSIQEPGSDANSFARQ